jgi:hypothetical protein
MNDFLPDENEKTVDDYLKAIAAEIGEREAFRLDSLIMNTATASTLDEFVNKTEPETLLGHPVYLSEAVPPGEAFLIPRQVMEFKWKPQIERAKTEYDEQIAFRFAQRFASEIDTLLFGGDYVSLVERLEIPGIFRWSAAQVAAVLFIVMFFIVLLLS